MFVALFSLLRHLKSVNLHCNPIPWKLRVRAALTGIPKLSLGWMTTAFRWRQIYSSMWRTVVSILWRDRQADDAVSSLMVQLWSWCASSRWTEDPFARPIWRAVNATRQLVSDWWKEHKIRRQLTDVMLTFNSGHVGSTSCDRNSAPRAAVLQCLVIFKRDCFSSTKACCFRAQKVSIAFKSCVATFTTTQTFSSSNR